MIEELDFLSHIIKKRNFNSAISFVRFFIYKYPKYKDLRTKIEELDSEIKRLPHYIELIKEINQILEDSVYSKEK